MKSISLQKRAAYSIIILLGICAVTWSFNSCNKNKNGEYKKMPADTTQTWVKFVTPNDMNWIRNGITPDNAMDALLTKVVKDTLSFDSTDTNTLTKKWKRDSLYFAILQKPVIDTATKKPKIDSLGKVIYQPPIIFILDKKFVLHDYNKNPNKP